MPRMYSSIEIWILPGHWVQVPFIVEQLLAGTGENWFDSISMKLTFCVCVYIDFMLIPEDAGLESQRKLGFSINAFYLDEDPSKLLSFCSMCQQSGVNFAACRLHAKQDKKSVCRAKMLTTEAVADFMGSIPPPLLVFGIFFMAFQFA